MLKMIKNVYALLDDEDRKAFYKYIVFAAIAPVIDLVGISALLPILQKIKDGNVTDIMVAETIGLGCLMIFKGVFDLVRSQISTKFTNNTSKKLSLKIFEVHNKEELLKHNDRSAASMLTAVRSDTAQSIAILVHVVSIAVSGITFAGLSLILMYFTKILGIVSVMLLLGMMLVTYASNRARIRKYGEKMRSLSIGLNAIVTTAYGSFKELKISTKADNMLKRYDQAAEESATVQREYDIWSTVANVVTKNTIQAALYFAIAVILCLKIDVTAYIVELIAFATITIKMIPETGTIVSHLNSIKYAENAYKELMGNIASYEAIKAKESAKESLRNKEVTINKSLRIEDLTFAYPNGRTIFDHASAEFEAGHTIAIVGNSGIGKTSLLDLMLGLLKPNEGHIYYDDYDIVDGRDNEGPCNGALGAVVSYIPQVVYMWGDSIKNNVVFMSDPDEIDDNKVRKCLACAHVLEDVEQMPEGINSVVGVNGTLISGGQRQRIALARALYRDFELLVMDEATAALDTETERAIIDSIRDMEQGKTLIMVTHHMSLAEECEMIYKIEDCKIKRIR